MSDPETGLTDLLWQARAAGSTLPLPHAEPPLDLAYAVQRALHRHTNLPVMVWKIGLTAEAPRRALGAAGPIVGRLAASAIYNDRSSIDFVGTEMFAEAELVFELGQDLPPSGAPYSRDAVTAALKGVYPGIEIARSRFAESDLPLGLLVADNAMGHGLVLGPKLSSGWEESYSAMPVTLERSDGTRAEGSTARVMRDPLDALVWIANWLCEQEGGLMREQLVASGTCTGVTEIFAGDTIVAQFGDTRRVQISVTGKGLAGGLK